MQVNLDLSKWKKDPKFWVIAALFLGGTNAGELLKLAKETLTGSQEVQALVDSVVTREARARQAGDSALLVEIRAGAQRDSQSNARVEKAVEDLSSAVLKIPQVARYADEKAKADSARRRDEWRRRRFFDREARGPMLLDRETR